MNKITNDHYQAQHRYDDIINLPHHVSSVHPPMPPSDRAAQFSPFAALTGYHDAIEEEARFTDEKRELDEDAKALLDEKLRQIQSILACQTAATQPGTTRPAATKPAVTQPGTTRPAVTVTYFLSDAKKSGGTYVSAAGVVKKIDFITRRLLLEGGKAIKLEDIAEIEIS